MEPIVNVNDDFFGLSAKAVNFQLRDVFVPQQCTTTNCVF